jgi:HAD superfamily hydrolase (TIGR01509 family)
MLKAIIFDCDGVIVDSEPHHLRAFQTVLAEEGIPLTREAYYEKYLAMDDKGAFETVLAEWNRPADKDAVKPLILRKKGVYQALSQEKLILYPGVVDFVQKAQGRYHLAIASGAFRAEIKAALDYGHIRDAFPVIVSAQDVRRGKPHPEAYLTALQQLNERTNEPPMLPSECVVIEDSLHGVEAARAAGMRCLAVTNSYPREMLNGRADRIVDSLIGLDPASLGALCGPSLSSIS